MSNLVKFATGLTLAVLIAILGFGWHLKGIYQGYVASTSVGQSLYPKDVLDDYGNQIAQELSAKNVEVAIISRAGQPRENLPKGVAYTHSAFFVRQDGGQDGGGEYWVFNLYHEEDNRLRSYLQTDRASDFLRLLREPDAGLIIPDAETQSQMKAFIGSPEYLAMHTQDYSLISNPLDLRWQNCNEFMLYALGAMIWQTTDKEIVRGNIEAAITPTTLAVSPIRRHFGPMIDERLILRDQGKVILTTTSADLAELLRAQNRLSESYRLTFN